MVQGVAEEFLADVVSPLDIDSVVIGVGDIEMDSIITVLVLLHCSWQDEWYHFWVNVDRYSGAIFSHRLFCLLNERLLWGWHSDGAGLFHFPGAFSFPGTSFSP